MRPWLTSIVLILLLGLPAAATAVDKPYFYPYVNPLEATVMELPSFYHADIPDKVPTKTFKVYPFPEREIPKVFVMSTY